MIDARWRNGFQDHILYRGEDYADSGLVDHLQVEKDKITATVHGSSDYNVKISLKNGLPTEMRCSCPYARDGNKCKHMAAVLYEAEDISEGSGETQDTDLSALLAEASKEELISFIRELAANDPSVSNRLRVKFTKKLSAGDMKELKREVDHIFRSHEYRGFIDYDEAYALQSDIDEFMENKIETLMDHGAYADAFEITTYFFVKLANTEIDDDGEIASISESCYDIWKRIVASCTKTEYNRIKAWFRKNADAGTLVDYMGEVLQDFLENELASEEDLREQMKHLDEEIALLDQKTDCPTVYSFAGPSMPLVVKRIELMKRLGTTEEEVEAYRFSQRHFSVIRKQYMEEAEKAGDRQKLIELLKEGKTLDAEHSYLVYEYSLKLAAIYHQANEREKERDERYEMFFTVRGKNIHAFRAVKALCLEEEWPKYRDGMLDAAQYEELKCEIYAEEKMTAQLYALVFEKEDIPMLDRYGTFLAEEYSEKILQVYEKYVRRIAENARNRAAYATLASYLERMKGYQGGKDLAAQLAAEWMEAYPTRKLMVNELGKFLFL